MEIEHNGITYEEVEISKTSDVIDEKLVSNLLNELKDEKCVENAIEIAKATNSKCVEGFVFCLVTKQGEVGDKVIRHCWNKINNQYFDATNEYVWSRNKFIATKYHYFEIDEFEPSEYVFKDGNYFISNAVEIAEQLDIKWMKEIESEESNTEDKKKNDDNISK